MLDDETGSHNGREPGWYADVNGIAHKPKPQKPKFTQKVNPGLKNRGKKFGTPFQKGVNKQHDEKWYRSRHGKRMVTDNFIAAISSKMFEDEEFLLKTIDQMIADSGGVEPYEVILDLMRNSSSEYIRSKMAETAARFRYELPAQKALHTSINRVEIVFQAPAEAHPMLYDQSQVIDVVSQPVDEAVEDDVATVAPKAKPKKPKNIRHEIVERLADDEMQQRPGFQACKARGEAKKSIPDAE